MKKILTNFLVVCSFCSCGKYVSDFTTAPCTSPNPSVSYSKAARLEKILDEFTQKGVPGISLAVLSDEGYWSAAKGYARIEDKTLMQTCHLQYLQSISKTYLAVAVLKLYEQGKIKLDESITNYLPQKYHRYVAGAANVTVRMLMNHTSGIPEYNFRPAYVTYLLQHPDHVFTPEDYLKFIEGKELIFTPGSKYLYTNTNYVLLSLIADSISGDHAKLISETIFKPLNLVHTFYRGEPNYLKYPELVNTYWDRYSNGILENVSEMQRINVQSLVGDDGIVSTPTDAVKFLKALATGQLLSASAMQEMKTWVNNDDGEPAYGLGLSYRKLNGTEGFGHSGGGIGAGCELYYFPGKNICYFAGMNLGTVTESPLHADLEKTLSKLHDVLLE